MTTCCIWHCSYLAITIYFESLCWLQSFLINNEIERIEILFRSRIFLVLLTLISYS